MEKDKEKNKVEENKVETKNDINDKDKEENKVETKNDINDKDKEKKDKPNKESGKDNGENTDKVVEKKVIEKKPKLKKEFVVANGKSLKISPKYSFAICKVIKGKSPRDAITRLEDVIIGKRVIPTAGLEVAHQKGKGIAGGKYPRNACIEIIKIIKQGEGNALVHGIENPIIKIASANRASAPFRAGGRKAKRTHIHLKLVSKEKLAGEKK